MPYITKEEREKVYDNKRGTIHVNAPTTIGQLNYAITMLVASYFRRFGGNYQQANDVMGALACAGQEFYRRCMADYENQKKSENGDVYQ